jgi:predicted acyltransferase
MRIALASLLAFLSSFIGLAYAAVPAGVSTALSGIQTDGLAVADLVWPVVLALIGASILFKVVKRFMNKA